MGEPDAPVDCDEEEDLFEVVGEPDAPVDCGEGEDKYRDQGLSRRLIWNKDKFSIEAKQQTKSKLKKKSDIYTENIYKYTRLLNMTFLVYSVREF